MERTGSATSTTVLWMRHLHPELNTEAPALPQLADENPGHRVGNGSVGIGPWASWPLEPALLSTAQGTSQDGGQRILSKQMVTGTALERTGLLTRPDRSQSQEVAQLGCESCFPTMTSSASDDGRQVFESILIGESFCLYG